MALTPSTMLPLGTRAPDFDLPEVRDGRRVTLAEFAGSPALLVAFICRHCPYVVHVREELGRIAADYGGRGLAVVGVASNDVAAYPDDAPDRIAEMARELGWRFPVVYDETQEVAKAYRAACTPEFYLFDASRSLVYRGQLDGTRPGGRAADGADLRAAIEAVLAGREVPREQRPSVGCNIKWKPGNAPAY